MRPRKKEVAGGKVSTCADVVRVRVTYGRQ